MIQIMITMGHCTNISMVRGAALGYMVGSERFTKLL